MNAAVGETSARRARHSSATAPLRRSATGPALLRDEVAAPEVRSAQRRRAQAQVGLGCRPLDSGLDGGIRPDPPAAVVPGSGPGTLPLVGTAELRASDVHAVAASEEDPPGLLVPELHGDQRPRASSRALIARLVAVMRQASSRSSKTSSGSASSSRTLTHAEEFVIHPAS